MLYIDIYVYKLYIYTLYIKLILYMHTFETYAYSYYMNVHYVIDERFPTHLGRQKWYGSGAKVKPK